MSLWEESGKPAGGSLSRADGMDVSRRVGLGYKTEVALAKIPSQGHGRIGDPETSHRRSISPLVLLMFN